MDPPSLPRKLQIEPVGRCNLKCPMCVAPYRGLIHDTIGGEDALIALDLFRDMVAPLFAPGRVATSVDFRSAGVLLGIAVIFIELVGFVLVRSPEWEGAGTARSFAGGQAGKNCAGLARFKWNLNDC